MDKRNKIKAGLFFGFAMTVFFILQTLLTHENLTTKNVIASVASDLVGGAFAGLLFGWLMGLFSNSKFIMQATKINTGDDETILFVTPANHFKGMEAVGGKLYLTNKRLVFKSHKLNIQNHELTVNVSAIQNVDRYKTMGIIDNGLSVTTMNGTVEKFVVQQANDWFSHLTSIRSVQPTRN